MLTKRNYKLRIYHIGGSLKGNLDHEEYFSTKDEMMKRYKQLFHYDWYAFNPTAWENVDGLWVRLKGL